MTKRPRKYPPVEHRRPNGAFKGTQIADETTPLPPPKKGHKQVRLWQEGEAGLSYKPFADLIKEK